jgi:hypothetical protein
LDHGGVQRLRGQVIGPSAPGLLRVRLGKREIDVPFEVIPPELRGPNSQFVAVLHGGEMLRVEPESAKWTQILQEMRAVFNTAWDPIGVAGEVSDEYDAYAGVIYSMLAHGSTDAEIAERLLRIEVDSIGLQASSLEHRLEVVQRLRALKLPKLRR